MDLEKAVDLMERDRPGVCDTLPLYILYVSWSRDHLLYLHVIPLICPTSDEALRLLRQTNCHSGLILAETHPLQGELEDAMARAYATLGENKDA